MVTISVLIASVDIEKLICFLIWHSTMYPSSYFNHVYCRSLASSLICFKLGRHCHHCYRCDRFKFDWHCHHWYRCDQESCCNISFYLSHCCQISCDMGSNNQHLYCRNLLGYIVSIVINDVVILSKDDRKLCHSSMSL